jgi:hypothetical protein
VASGGNQFGSEKRKMTKKKTELTWTLCMLRELI